MRFPNWLKIDLFGRQRDGGKSPSPSGRTLSLERSAAKPTAPRRPTEAEARAAVEAKARAEARAEALAYAFDVMNVCALAERPELAGRFLRLQTPLPAVRSALIAAMADAQSEEEISSQIAPEGTEERAVWDRAVDKANERPN